MEHRTFLRNAAITGWALLGLTVGITLAAGGSASADDQSSSPNANAVDQFLDELSNPSIAPSSVPKCSSPVSKPSPFRILDNQQYALCAVASCFVFNKVAYCKCDVEFGDSISLTFDYDNGKDVCTVNEEGATNGSYVVSTFSFPPSVAPGGDQTAYDCPASSDGDYAQCDGGICATSTQGKSFPGFDDSVAKNQTICSCPITKHSPKAKVGFQIAGPFPCQQSFFQNCNKKTANSKTGSTIYVGAPTGTGRLVNFLLYGRVPHSNPDCVLPHD